MKYCEEYAALLDLYVDGELPAEELEQVRKHLETCPGCRAYVDDALAIRAGFPEAEDTEVPEGFVESVMERVMGDAGKPAERRYPWKRAASLTALAACCALVIFAGSRVDPPWAGGGSAAPMAASAGADAADTAGNEASPAAPQAEENAIAPETAPEEEEEFAVATARTAGAPDMERALAGDVSSYNAAAPKAVLEEELDLNVTKHGEVALYLTAEEAGDALKGFTPVQEDAAGRWYELNAEEYQTLLETLGRAEKFPETEETVFPVVVAPAAE